MLTTAYTDLDFPGVTEGVYAPQEDTQLLVDVMEKTGLAHGHRVGDLCTGSGVVPIAGCEQGAAKVTATFTSDREPAPRNSGRTT